MAVSDTLIDTLFDGRYQVVRKLGAGGMANVYLAEDEELGRRVAIKILNDRHANDEQFVERFRREAKNAAGLSHPNIVSIYDRGEAEGTYYIAMEYLDGRTLKELDHRARPAADRGRDRRTRARSSPRCASRTGNGHRPPRHQAAQHARRRGRAREGDGLRHRARRASSQMTEAGSIIGTAQYLSPEQARGAPVDQRSDLYSVGDRPLRDADRDGAVHRRHAGRDRDEAPLDDAGAAVARCARRSRTTSTWSSCARSRRTRTTATRRAEEMDADLERVARGRSASPPRPRRRRRPCSPARRSADGADGDRAAARRAARRAAAAPPPYYDYEEPPRAAPDLAVAARAPPRRSRPASPAGTSYEQIQDQLERDEPVAVPYVVGLSSEASRSTTITDAGLERRTSSRRAERDVEAGRVFDQEPEGGHAHRQGRPVDDLGLDRAAEVDGAGRRRAARDDAVAALDDVEPEGRTCTRSSREGPPDKVIAQDPPAGRQVDGGRDRAHQRLDGAAAGRRAERRRRSRRRAPSTLAGAGFEVARARRRLEPSRRTPSSTRARRRRLAARGLDRHAHRLEGARGRDRAGRDEPRPDSAHADARGSRLQGRRPVRRPRPTRTRTASSSPGSGRRHASAQATGHVTVDDRRRHDATTTTTTTPMSRRLRVAVAHGRPLERARHLARVGALGARRARPGALRRRDRRDRPRRRWELGAGRGPGSSGDRRVGGETLPVPPPTASPAALGGVDVVLPILHGPVRRGRHRAGAARARRRPLRRRRRRRPRRSHGQGPLQGGDARQRHPRRAQRHAPARRRGREPVRLPGVREAGAARLVGRHLEGARRESSAPAVELARRHDEKVLVEEFVDGDRGRVRRARQPRRRSRRSRARSSRSTRVVRLRGEVRRGRHGARRSRRASAAARRSSACRSSRSTRSSRRECEGMARVDFFVRERRRGARQRAEHDPRLHRDERLREALRGVGHPVRASSSTA